LRNTGLATLRHTGLGYLVRFEMKHDLIRKQLLVLSNLLFDI